jgi:hypothetical protein
LLYLIYELGGYPALSWLGCLASVAATVLLLAGGSATGAALAILAVPLIAERTKPRADLFSTLLFAAVLVILWRHFQRRRSPLWLLPVIMCAWANLHLGFIAGLLLIGSYVVMEAAELPWPGRRSAALAGLRAAAPWLAAAILATLANRWGPWLYGTLFRQSRLLEGLGSFVGEWFPLRLSAATARAVLDWRNPDSAYLWLALAGLLAAIAALLQKRPGPALLILGSLFGSLYWVRFQAFPAPDLPNTPTCCPRRPRPRSSPSRRRRAAVGPDTSARRSPNSGSTTTFDVRARPPADSGSARIPRRACRSP